MTVPQQVDEAEPLPVSKTLTTTPLPDQAIRAASSCLDRTRPGQQKAAVQVAFSRSLSLAQALSMTFLTASLALPTASWASPLPFCKAPLTFDFR